MTTWRHHTFKTAAEWIRASSAGGVPDAYVEHLATICKQRKGVWTVLKNRPSPTKELRRALIWDAFKIGRHAATWGDLSAWSERTTGALLLASDAEKETFEYVMDTTIELARAARERRTS